MQLQNKSYPILLRDTRAAHLLLLRHSVEHIGHIKELAHQARKENKYAESWMWLCLIMMFGYGVRVIPKGMQEGNDHLREAIRRYDIAFKLSINEEQEAREIAQCLFDEMGAKTRRKIARHNRQWMIQ
jgi:hypothetical protein